MCFIVVIDDLQDQLGEVDKSDNSPLHLAAEKGSDLLVKELLDEGN